MTEITLQTTVELPGGVYNVVSLTRYRGLDVTWAVYDLDDGEGRTAQLAQVGESFYSPTLDTADLPPSDSLLLDEVTYALRRRGEARAEHSDRNAHDFWLASFRLYSAPGKVAIFTVDRDTTHRLLGTELGSGLVHVLGDQ